MPKPHTVLTTVPLFVSIVFILTVLITVFFLLNAIAASYKKQRIKAPIWIIPAIVVWLAVQAILAYKNFYVYTSSIPPRFALAVLPMLLCIVILFVTDGGKKFIDNLPLSILTYIHVVRILVEVVLYWLFLSKAVPEIMTFAGRNFDIVAGITAPAMGYLFFKQKVLSYKVVIAWNVLCILLLLNIVVLAVLSAPFPFQHFGFEQPNVAILHFPFVWLPCFVVPVVLFAHLASIRQLLIKKTFSWNRI
jgi:hypothetical protein